jgi:methionyl-tRNA formyltransferase
MTRLAFLGTPGAAVPTLRSLAERHEVPLVVTQPDRPRGRSRAPVAPPVKEEARRLGLEVAQPTSAVGLREVLESAGDLELAVVVAYGRILRGDALAIPTHGMLNVHFSLLPRWRGAAPVARALIAGDSMTGVTLIKLDEGLDTGPVLTAQAVDIRPEENAGELTSRLALLGARLIVDSIPDYLAGDLPPVRQTDEGMAYASKIAPGDRPLRVHGPRGEALNRVRGLAPEPGATLLIDGGRHQVMRAGLHEASPSTGRWVEVSGAPVAGFADGGLELLEVQPPGKRPMSGRDWLRGRHRGAGTVA